MIIDFRRFKYEMGGCRCTFRGCQNSTVTTPKMHFFHFPFKDILRCKKWASNSNNLDFLTLPDNKLRNKVVCEAHFVEKAFMNFKKERLIKTAVPTLLKLDDGAVQVFECSDEDAEKLDYTKGSDEIDLPPAESPKLLNKWSDFNHKTPENTIMLSKRKTSHTSHFASLNKQSKIEPEFEFIEPATLTQTNDDSTVFKVSLDFDATNTVIATAKPKVIRPKIIKMRSQLPTVKHEKDSISPVSTTTILNNIKIEPMTTPKPSPIARRISYSVKKESNQFNSNAKQIQVLENTLVASPNVGCILNASSSTNEEIATPDTNKLENMSKQIEELKALLTAKSISESSSSSAAPTSFQNQYVKIEKGPALQKVQLFNGIRKYLNPSMVALLRMEMFGSNDREYRPDEKQFSKELFNLNESVYEYMRDEWRFRLPPKTDVQSWLENQDDEDVWELC